QGRPSVPFTTDQLHTPPSPCTASYDRPGSDQGGFMAGGSAGRKAQEARRKERELREQWQSAARQAQRWEAASEGERRVAAQLLVLTGQGWRLLVDRRWPGTRSGN